MGASVAAWQPASGQHSQRRGIVQVFTLSLRVDRQETNRESLAHSNSNRDTTPCGPPWAALPPPAEPASFLARIALYVHNGFLQTARSWDTKVGEQTANGRSTTQPRVGSEITPKWGSL